MPKLISPLTLQWEVVAEIDGRVLLAFRLKEIGDWRFMFVEVD
jgi:hypothetical protein